MSSRSWTTTVKSGVAAAIVLLAAAGMTAADIPAHPGELTYPTYTFEPPVATEYRSEVAGVPVYLVPSHELPLITVTFTFKGGSYLEDDAHVGLAQLLGTMMRRGGTTTVPAEELDERFDFLAARVDADVGTDSSSATLNCLTSNFQEAFALFVDMVRRPGFDSERLRLEKDRVIEVLKQRNDRPDTVAQMYVRQLIYGADHFSARLPTKATIEAIDPEALGRLHGQIFHPGNLVIGVTGDFQSAAMHQAIAAALAGWQTLPRVADPPAPGTAHEPGLYHAATAQEDLPQGTGVLVTRALERDHPDEIPMSLMNHILGGGGFTSRIMSRVRSDEGLAYVAQTILQPNVHYPGVFLGFFRSRNRMVALATQIFLQEIERIASEPVSAEELRSAKEAYIERFPQMFSSRQAVMAVLVNDELTDRPADYWQTYRRRIAAVTAEDVQRVARENLSPEQMVILVVGEWEEIYGGDLEGRASMSAFFGGHVNHLPMRDPLTLKPMPTPERPAPQANPGPPTP